MAYPGELGDPPSPAYVPESPNYQPTASPNPYSSTSPAYIPKSPDYNFDSPPPPPSPSDNIPSSKGVTVTETRTITGPPELVLPPAQSGFRSYVPGQQNITPETPDSFGSQPGDRNVFSNEERLQMIRDEPDDDPDDDLDYERGFGSGSGSKEENKMENKVLRTIKEVDDSKGLSLLKTINDEDSKTSVTGNDSQTKNVKTD